MHMPGGPDHSSGSRGLRAVSEAAVWARTRQLMRTGFRANPRVATPLGCLLTGTRNAMTITLYLSQVLVARQTLRAECNLNEGKF